MNIAPIFTYNKLINFCSNIKFKPVKSKEDAVRAAELYSSMATNINSSKPAKNFLAKINAQMQKSYTQDLFYLSSSNTSHHIELVEKDNAILGVYSLDYKKGYPTAFVDFMVESSKIRQTKLSKEFLFAIADRICEIASNNNIKNIRWNASIRNVRAINLYRKFNAETFIDLKSNNIIYTISVDKFKKNIENYKKRFR